MLDYFWPLFGKRKDGKYITWNKEKETQILTLFLGSIFIICYTAINRLTKEIFYIIRIIIDDINTFIKNKRFDKKDSQFL